MADSRKWQKSKISATKLEILIYKCLMNNCQIDVLSNDNVRNMQIKGNITKYIVNSSKNNKTIQLHVGLQQPL